MAQRVYYNNLLSDEQNGFRIGRSTIEQRSTLTSIIDVRKQLRKSTFCAFVDFKKAYDTINRNILWRKLNTLSVADFFMFCYQVYVC